MKYSLVKRGNPRYPERKKKVYACAQYEQVLSLDELIEHIVAHGSPYSRGDYKAIVSRLAEAMAEKLKDGYKIDLGELGKYYTTLECEGAESIEEFDPEKHIKTVNVKWEPGSDFKNLRHRADFRLTIDRRTERMLIKAEKEGLGTIDLSQK